MVCYLAKGRVMNHRWNVVCLAAVASFSLSLSLGCSSSNFKGSPGTSNKNLNAAGTNGDANPSNGGGSGGSGTTDGAGNGAGSGGNVTDGSGTAGNLAQTGENNGTVACKPDTNPNSYNIMFIFDKTGSQLVTDPTNVRRSGALSFLSQFNNYFGKFPAAQVYMGVLAFNTQSIHSTNGWMLLNSINASVIQQEIVTATSNPNGLTSFSPVLQDAANYFKQVNALQNAQSGRNYIVFLTDGDPNADTAQAIKDAVDNLVNNYGVAVIAVATGPDVTASGQKMVQSLALPATATKFPDHVGRYYRAPDASTLDKTWNNLFGSLGGCK